MDLYSITDAEKILGELNPEKSQSFLLEGQEGVGKEEIALKFAINLLGNEVRVRENSHPDFLLIERKIDEKTGKRKAEILVESTRKIADFLNLTPAEGDHRVCILNSADMLNISAANSILKILEEPPKRSVIILLSHGGHILPTIRSRCTAIKFQPATQDELLNAISTRIPDISDEDKALLLLISNGSIGLAEKIYHNNGINVSRETLQIFASFPHFDLTKITKFLSSATKSTETWAIFKTIFTWLIINIAKHKALGQELIVEEYNLNSSLQNFDKFLATEKKFNEDIKNAEIFNLDKKQVMLDIIRSFSACYG